MVICIDSRCRFFLIHWDGHLVSGVKLRSLAGHKIMLFPLKSFRGHTTPSIVRPVGTCICYLSLLPSWCTVLMTSSCSTVKYEGRCKRQWYICWKTDLDILLAVNLRRNKRKLRRRFFLVCPMVYNRVPAFDRSRLLLFIRHPIYMLRGVILWPAFTFDQVTWFAWLKQLRQAAHLVV